jgi:high-affinity iron transporter
VEEGFLRLRTEIREPGADVEPIARTLDAELEAARAALQPRSSVWARFLQSATIILREGFEVVLVVAALLAYVRRTGNLAMRRPILVGVGLGILASGGTAVLLATVFKLQPAMAEALEGAAMLLAAVVLFWVSYWIISKAEADRWQRYIHGKVQHAVAAGSGAALAAASFLAVYREGFETVLFYQALIGSAPAGDTAIGLGFLAGSVLLAIVYALFMRFGFRIPIRPFFLATGTLLYVMAVVFAGRGVHELQEAGVIGMTFVDWAPTLDAIGLYPTVETLIAQLVLLVPVAIGLAITPGRRRRARASSAIREELGRLRELAEAMRTELDGLRAVEAAAGIGPRLDGLIARVRELEARVRETNGRG